MELACLLGSTCRVLQEKCFFFFSESHIIKINLSLTKLVQSSRLWAASLFLENSWGRTQNQARLRARLSLVVQASEDEWKETALALYNNLDATLTSRNNDTWPVLNMTLQWIIFYAYLSTWKLYLVRCDEWFDTLQLKPGKWPLKKCPYYMVKQLYSTLKSS